MIIDSTKLNEIIKEFEEWYINDKHSKNEDFYSNSMTFESISKLSQKEFEDFFLEFAKEGGKIQSGGARTANKFIQGVHDNFSEFKEKVLAPFQSNFDVVDWIKWAESFKYFGKGLATIYLNRVDKTKYVVVNNKSIKAYKKLGYEVANSPLDRTYRDLLRAQSDIIDKYPLLNNFFRTDALSHYLIGTTEGITLLKNNNVYNSLNRTITKEDVEKAIERIDKNPSLRKGRESTEYDLVFNGVQYPPILVLSEANIISGGEGLLLSDFGNSTKDAFTILTNLGFTIERKKISFADQLRKFIFQSENGILTIAGYINSYKNLDVKVSFGKGNQARISWIAFLGKGNVVQNGIYPVYLYFKKNKILILAYGVSEANIPSINWELTNPKSVATYFEENEMGRPERYGNSFVYKVYSTINPLDPKEINRDLDDLIENYKREIINQNISITIKQVDLDYKSFKESTDSANLLFDKNIIIRFISALLTKPFVILTGLSGSGKTKLAQAFAKWICETDDQFCLVPVGSDWTNREPLLGFPSALEKGRYILPDNGVLSLIIEASKEENQYKPYILILDEMNLSHVERYFADFLSAMESNELIPLHPETGEWVNNKRVPASIVLPKNLFIIGTVNVDETTYMFSPKVLDRANVIEFSVSHDEMNDYLKKSGSLDIDSIKGWGSKMAGNFLNLSWDKGISLLNKDEIASSLLKFFSELKRIGAEFGYRSASEIMRFSAIINIIEPSWGTNEIIDVSVMQKLLPKVHGSRRKLEPVLRTLATLCLKEEFKNSNGFKIENLLNAEELIIAKDNMFYPVSFEKIKRMYRRLIDNGFTSYAEA